MKYSIYQLANIHDSRYGFMRWEFAKDHGFNINDYVCTYEGDKVPYKNGMSCEDPSTALEILFTIFNIHRSHDFKGHSLSVSDVVELTSDGRSEYYYCDSFGWKNITESLLLA